MKCFAPISLAIALVITFPFANNAADDVEVPLSRLDKVGRLRNLLMEAENPLMARIPRVDRQATFFAGATDSRGQNPADLPILRP